MIVIKTTTPIARKDYTCDLCHQQIPHGTRYKCVILRADGRLVTQHVHQTCPATVSEALSSGVVSNNPRQTAPLFIQGGHTPEEIFRQQIHADVQARLHKFTREENLLIAYAPLVITELSWRFAFKTVELAAHYRISELKKLSRTVKMMFEKQRGQYLKDLKPLHIKQIETQTDRFMQLSSSDLTILYFSINNELKKKFPDLSYLDLRTEACRAMVMLKFHKEHQRKMDALIKERMGYVNHYATPIHDALYDAMDAYADPATVDFSGHVATSMKILQKNIGQMDFKTF